MNKQALFIIEESGDYFYFKAPNGYTVDDILNIAKSEDPWENLNSIGEEVSLYEYAVIEQSDKFTFSVHLNFDGNTAAVYMVNNGLGGISEEDRTDEDCSFYNVPIYSLTSDVNSAADGNFWGTIVSGSNKFFTGIVTPVSTEVANSEIALAFLVVTFVGLGVGLFKRIARSLGRGH